MQAEAELWCTGVAGMRQCRPLDGATPAWVFAAAEKDALKPLPAGPFVLATCAKAKIGPDICARVGKVLYSLDAVAAHRQDRRRPPYRDDGAVLHRR